MMNSICTCFLTYEHDICRSSQFWYLDCKYCSRFLTGRYFLAAYVGVLAFWLSTAQRQLTTLSIYVLYPRIFWHPLYPLSHDHVYTLYSIVKVSFPIYHVTSCSNWLCFAGMMCTVIDFFDGIHFVCNNHVKIVFKLFRAVWVCHLQHLRVISTLQCRVIETIPWPVLEY